MDAASEANVPDLDRLGVLLDGPSFKDIPPVDGTGSEGDFVDENLRI